MESTTLKKIIVTGFESSGTQWMTSVISKHPGVREAVHTSIPEFLGENTRWPELDDCDKILWMIRYEPFRLMSISKRGFELGRPIEFMRPWLYEHAERIYSEHREKIVFGYYGSLVGPTARITMDNLLIQLGLNPDDLPKLAFIPRDENMKYILNILMS